MLNFCTLFDSNYLDKGITLYHSLEDQVNDFHLYVLPMNETCSNILKQINYKNLSVIDYNDFLTDALKVAKGNRSAGEFCWTCTPFVIDYCLKKYNLDLVTYIDSDLYFFDDPKILIDEMVENNSDVQIIRHNFWAKEYKDYVKASGEFCVQFNTFQSTDKAYEILNEWMKECIDDCSYNIRSNVFGDQKYLNTWPQKYDCVNISENLGAGVAPWNIRRFSYTQNAKGKHYIIDSETNKNWPIIFFHFQNLLQVSDDKFYCCYVKKSQKEKVKIIYQEYIEKLVANKEMLRNNYGIYPKVEIHPVVATYKDDRKEGKGILKRIKHVVASCYYYLIKMRFLYTKLFYIVGQ